MSSVHFTFIPLQSVWLLYDGNDLFSNNDMYPKVVLAVTSSDFFSSQMAWFSHILFCLVWYLSLQTRQKAMSIGHIIIWMHYYLKIFSATLLNPLPLNSVLLKILGQRHIVGKKCFHDIMHMVTGPISNGEFVPTWSPMSMGFIGSISISFWSPLAAECPIMLCSQLRTLYHSSHKLFLEVNEPNSQVSCKTNKQKSILFSSAIFLSFNLTLVWPGGWQKQLKNWKIWSSWFQSSSSSHSKEGKWGASVFGSKNSRGLHTSKETWEQ